MLSDAPAAPIDILDALLSAPSEQAFPGQEALSRLIRRAAAPAPKPTRAVAPPAPRHAAPAPAKHQSRVKTTQYLDAATHAQLNHTREILSALPNSPDLGRLSKSRIVETALRQVLEEFEAKGPQSRLVRDLQHSDEA